MVPSRKTAATGVDGATRCSALSKLVALLTVAFATMPLAVVPLAGGSAVRPAVLEYPPSLFWESMAYDSQSDRMVVFGGTSDDSLIADAVLSNQTWVLDVQNASWTRMRPQVSPPARVGAAMAYDAESDRIVLYGGGTRFSSPGDLNDTWAYDYDQDQWVEMTPPIAPAPRLNSEMVYLALQDRIVLFGGSYTGGYYNETWAYDFNRNNWSRVVTLDSPPGLDSPGLAFDSESNRIVLFGGFNGPTEGSNETWLFDPVSNAWQRASPTPFPGGRYFHQLAYDESADRVILVGGEQALGPLNRRVYTDTWEFDANNLTWTRIFPNQTYTGSRYGPRMAYSQGEGKVVLFAAGSPWLYDSVRKEWLFWRWPEAPYAMQASADVSRIDLRWNPPNGTIDSTVARFILYRGTDRDNLTRFGEVVGQRTFADTNLTNGTEYWYAVATTNAVGEGPLSEPVNAVAIVPPASFGPSPTPPLPPGIPGLSLAAIILAAILVATSAAGRTSRGNEAIAGTLLVPLFTRLRRDDVRNQYNRGRLIQFIRDNPGANFTQVRKDLGLSNGGCAYHLQVLERSGEIRRVAQGPSVRFYASDYKFDAEELPPLAYLQRRILEVVVDLQSTTFSGISHELGSRGVKVTEKNLGYHLKVLTRDKELLKTSRDVGRSVYFVDAEQREFLRKRLKDERGVDEALGIAAATERPGPPHLEPLANALQPGDVVVTVPTATSSRPRADQPVEPGSGWISE